MNKFNKQKVLTSKKIEIRRNLEILKKRKEEKYSYS